MSVTPGEPHPIHMIEETARHVGHMDILRELIDGAIGDHNRD